MCLSFFSCPIHCPKDLQTSLMSEAFQRILVPSLGSFDSHRQGFSFTKHISYTTFFAGKIQSSPQKSELTPRVTASASRGRSANQASMHLTATTRCMRAKLLMGDLCRKKAAHSRAKDLL